MIVLGADTHKRSHTIAAVAAATGELLGERTVAVGRRGFDALLVWAGSLDGERVWALEDCRHVSGSLERFLIARGERVLRIPTHLSAGARKRARQRGKSDPIDALNIARAALQEGLDTFPAAHLDGPELDLRLLVDRRERLVGHRVELNSALLWHLHHLWPELRLPGGALFSKKWTTRTGGRLARAQQTMRMPIARDELRRLRELTQAINQLEREITKLVGQIAPQLLSEPGFGPLIAAKLVGEIAGAQRFATPANLARAAGVAPIPASSGNTRRQRMRSVNSRARLNQAARRQLPRHSTAAAPRRTNVSAFDEPCAVCCRPSADRRERDRVIAASVEAVPSGRCRSRVGGEDSESTRGPAGTVSSSHQRDSRNRVGANATRCLRHVSQTWP
jgi:transposase